MASNSVWVECNPNPAGRKTGDCVVRAVALALGISWDKAYALLCAKGFGIKDLPNNDSVWTSVLRDNGFTRTAIPDSSTGDTRVLGMAGAHMTPAIAAGTAWAGTPPATDSLRSSSV